MAERRIVFIESKWKMWRLFVQFLLHLLLWWLLKFVAKPMIERLVILPLTRLLLDDGDSDGVMIGESVEAGIGDITDSGVEGGEMG